ncbi:hypothetical protein VCHA43P277_160071 [Vibrio chagasii]|nr:hypothetical protein VCHA34P126_140104 [Vibrio chagasii]CAH6983540.1 hypothetical protein VCHA43P277_160071 [Vibrio chagasii]CAH7031739.1 hypothetical protein VCHA41O247_160071 [Vibrio chagasii]CAH7240758.1 hypothetical protein VCHA50P420_160026 [Vibrio chagasii]
MQANPIKAKLIKMYRFEWNGDFFSKDSQTPESTFVLPHFACFLVKATSFRHT